jgi:hypothetical protein
LRAISSLAAALTLLAAGCFSPRYDDEGPYCSTDGRCPGGFVCAQENQRCYRTGHVPAFDMAPAPPPTCMPQPEACNGADDDCDGVADNGCPVEGAALGAGMRSLSMLYGTTQDMHFKTKTTCDPPGVITALWGRGGVAIDQINADCGIPRVHVDKSDPTAFKYSVIVEKTQDRLGPFGGTTGYPWLGGCPDNQVVTAIKPSTFVKYKTFAGLAYTCSPLVIEGDPTSGFAVRATSTNDQPPAGAKPHPADTPMVQDPFVCAAGMFYGLDGYDGLWPIDNNIKDAVNGLAFSCFAPTVQLIPGT